MIAAKHVVRPPKKLTNELEVAIDETKKEVGTTAK
jgi:hypothetical protein